MTTFAAWPQNYITQAGTLFLSYEETTDTTNTGTGAAFTKDTSIVTVGSASLKVVTGAGNVAEVRKSSASIPATWGGKVGLLVYIPDYTKVATIGVYMAKEAAYTNFLLAQYNVNASAVNKFNGWHYIELGAGAQSTLKWATTGTTDVNTAVADMKVRVTPQGAEQATVYLDALYYGPRQRAKLLIMFDDGYDSVIDNGTSYLDTLGLKSTCGIIGSLIGQAGYMTEANLATLYAAGHDLCPHGETALPTLGTYAAMVADVQRNQEYLRSRGYTRAVNYYVYPNGEHEISAGDQTVFNALRACGIRWSRKASAKQAISPLCTADQLLCMPIIGHALADSNASIQAEIDGIILNAWTGILMFHRVLDAGASTSIDIATSDFEILASYISQKSVAGLLDVVTVSEWHLGLTQPQLV